MDRSDQLRPVDWDHRRPLSLGSRLALLAELSAGLGAVVIVVGLAARWSDAVARILF